MASKRCSDDKPELIALYRLEFYKNKRKWKLCSEKVETRKKSSSNTSAERNNLNETYELASKSEQEKTIVEDDVLTHTTTTTNELPTVVEPPLPIPAPPVPEDSPIVSKSVPSLPTSALETNQVPLLFTQPPPIIQGPHIWNQPPPLLPQPITENTWNNQNEINNNQWSQKPKTVNWESPPQSESYLPTFQNPNDFLFKSWTGPSKPNDPNPDNFSWKHYNQTNLPKPVLPSFSTILPSNNRSLLQERTWVYSESTIASTKQAHYRDSNIPLGAPPDCLTKLLCPNSYQNPSKDYQNYYQRNSCVPKANPNLNLKQNIYNGNSGGKVFVNRRFLHNVHNYRQQAVPGKYLPGSWSNGDNGPQFTCHKDIDFGLPKRSQGLLPTTSKFSRSISNNSEIPIRRNLKPEFWTVKEPGSIQKKPDIWINPALAASTESTSWEQQIWQQQEELKQYCEQDRQEWGRVVGNVSMEEDNITCIQETEQATLTPNNKYSDALSDARRETQECLRKLIVAYREKEMLEKGTQDITGNRATGQCQDALSESAEFIREVKYVPHSSEKDPNDTNESDLAYMNAVLVAPPGQLSGAKELHVATVLRDLLVEEQRKEQEKNRPIVNPFEYPTRDTDPHGGELILDGSHLPHSTALLDGPGAHNGVIRINMGRPYRL